jgi:transcriptional regulator with XRE-family HTH domain
MDQDSLKNRRELIAFRLREARRLAGLSQSQAAALLDLHRPAISEIEAGRRKVTAEEIIVLAELYQVDSAWLLGEGESYLDINDSRLKLAARELQKLKSDDLQRLLNLLASIPK